MNELLLTIDVVCADAVNVRGGKTEVNMVPFTGRAYGKLFTGRMIGTGVDTQKTDLSTGVCSLSARYMLQGVDAEGAPCRIFIENSLRDEAGWHPMLVTDSPLLAPWESLPLTASVDSTDKGVVVRIYSGQS